MSKPTLEFKFDFDSECDFEIEVVLKIEVDFKQVSMLVLSHKPDLPDIISLFSKRWERWVTC